MQTIREALTVDFPGNWMKKILNQPGLGHTISLWFIKRTYSYKTPCKGFNHVIYTPLVL